MPRSDQDAQTPDKSPELYILGGFHTRSIPWAESATKEALLLSVDKVSLPMLQAFECLTVYWFGVGNPRNGNLCSGTLLSSFRSQTAAILPVPPTI